MEIIDQLTVRAGRHAFLQHKKECQHLSDRELKRYGELLSSEQFQTLVQELACGTYSIPIPKRKTINKQGTEKKRVVYCFDDEMNLLLKLIGFCLNDYDNIFCENCYAFRQRRTVSDALRDLRSVDNIQSKYCLKIDVKNYFNSIDVPILLERLSFLMEQDARLYHFLEDLLTLNMAYEGEQIVTESRGAMAGTPISPFLANVYLNDTDWLFFHEQIPYFRYSDDIIILADSMEELEAYRERLTRVLQESHLALNEKKVAVSRPGDPITFLGFAYQNGRVGLAGATMEKMKGKIKRKAHALRKWAINKKLSPEKAAKGFIKAMNHKLFERENGNDFCWSRWFFPLLTDAEDLKIIDAYMQQYIRYIITGRHYKGNYKTTYEQMKEWGYRSLVNEYFQEKEHRKWK